MKKSKLFTDFEIEEIQKELTKFFRAVGIHRFEVARKIFLTVKDEHQKELKKSIKKIIKEECSNKKKKYD